MTTATAHRVCDPKTKAPPGYNATPMPDDASRPSGPPPRAYVARLYERYSEGLLGFFRASLPMSKEDATDLLQQTFVELLRWLQLEPSRKIVYPRAFLYRIAHRRLGRYRDKQRRIPDEPQGSEPTLDARAHRDDLEYMALQHERQRQALRAMRHLDDPDAQVLLYLRYWEGLTEEAVGAVLERGRSTVVGQIRRAKKALLAKVVELEQAQPNAIATSTTLLERWWRRVEAQAHGVDPDESDPADQFEGEGAPRRSKPR